MNIKEGDTYPSKYGLLKVLTAAKWDNVVVKFESTGFTTKTQAGNVERGSVKDPYYPRLFGIGFFGEGEHLAYSQGKVTKAYNAWANMITRCYSSEYHKKKPTYKKCSVCKDWHNFQNFAGWFYRNHVKGMHIDKDKMSGEDKIYSPETCKFITCQENSEIANAKSFTVTSPSGKRFDVYNLSKFCRENNLCSKNMSAVCLGKVTHHKGWTGYSNQQNNQGR